MLKRVTDVERFNAMISRCGAADDVVDTDSLFEGLQQFAFIEFGLRPRPGQGALEFAIICMLFDERNVEQVRRVMLASDEILGKCIDLGGSVTGEHGIGVEKISFMNRLFTDEDLTVMEDVRRVFNPDGRCSPGKLLPTAGACGMEHIEKTHPGRKAAM